MPGNPTVSCILQQTIQRKMPQDRQIQGLFSICLSKMEHHCLWLHPNTLKLHGKLKAKSDRPCNFSKGWKNRFSPDLSRWQKMRGEHGSQRSWKKALSNSCTPWIWMQQSFLLLLGRSGLGLESNGPTGCLLAEGGAVTNSHLGEWSLISRIYHTYMQVKNQKRKSLYSWWKTGDL